MPLVNTAIDALAKGGELKDDRVPGLSVRANASAKSFMLYYRTKTGIVRRPKLGDYGVLSISQAREIARQMLAEVAAGKDPVADRQALRDEPTVADLWARALAEHYEPGTKWTYEVSRLWKVRIKPAIGDTRVRAVDYDVIARLHLSLKATPTEANRCINVLSKLMELAEKWRWRPDGSNPCRHIERYPERSRRRYAKPDEIAKIGPILERLAAEAATIRPDWREERLAGIAFLYLLMFSGARPSEIEDGKPQDIERLPDGRGVLRLEDGKTGRRDIFLPLQAMRVIDQLPAKRVTLTGRRMPRKLWEKVRKEAGCPDLWARDWRRTFATVGLSAGTPIGVVGELLGHASTQTTKIYAKLMEDPAHKAAASIADRMEQMLKPPSSG